MRHFFVERESWAEGRVAITGSDAHHIAQVLRLKRGDVVAVADGTGRVGRLKIERVGGEAVEGIVVEETESAAQVGPPITLAQGLVKGRKFEQVIQKAVELGVSRVVPLSTARTVVRLKGDRAEERLERWRRIAMEAAKQCRRPQVPDIAPLATVEEFLAGLPPPTAGELRLLLWEEASEPLREVLARSGKPSSVVCLVGPEGGFEQNEASEATEAGFTPASLGARILRAETATVALLAILQHAFGGF